MNCIVEHDADVQPVDLFAALYWEDVASDVPRVNCSREIMSCLMT